MGKETKEKLLKKVEELSEDEECICLYTKLSDRELTYNTMIEDAENEGNKKGRKEGREEATINIAKKMLKENLNLEVISKVTGLTIEEIQNLK